MPLPNFTLMDQNSEPLSLSSLRGQRVVIYSTQRTTTPGCTKEACGFRDQWARYEQLGIKVLGISKDGAASHEKFIAKYTLPFTLLCDPEPCPVASAYGSYGLRSSWAGNTMGMMRHNLRGGPGREA